MEKPALFYLESSSIIYKKKRQPKLTFVFSVSFGAAYTP